MISTQSMAKTKMSQPSKLIDQAMMIDIGAITMSETISFWFRWKGETQISLSSRMMKVGWRWRRNSDSWRCRSCRVRQRRSLQKRWRRNPPRKRARLRGAKRIGTISQAWQEKAQPRMPYKTFLASGSSKCLSQGNHRLQLSAPPDSLQDQGSAHQDPPISQILTTTP